MDKGNEGDREGDWEKKSVWLLPQRLASYTRVRHPSSTSLSGDLRFLVVACVWCCVLIDLGGGQQYPIMCSGVIPVHTAFPPQGSLAHAQGIATTLWWSANSVVLESMNLPLPIGPDIARPKFTLSATRAQITCHPVPLTSPCTRFESIEWT